MTTIKGCTDIEQSKKLAEILPIESADMWYNNDGESTAGRPEIRCGTFTVFDSKNIPCWSLAALLSVLPRTVRLVGTPHNSYWYCECVDSNNRWYAGFGNADNPVDACVDMVFRVHKHKR